MSDTDNSAAPPAPAPAFVRWGAWGWFPFAEARAAASSAGAWLSRPTAFAGALCLVLGLVVGGCSIYTGGRILTPTPTISLPATLQAQPGRLTEIDAVTNGKTIAWETTATDYDVVTSTALPKAAFVFPTKGAYTVTARTALGNQIATAQCAVTVGDVPPEPVPPGPTPPVPPAPPAPIPDAGFRVLIVIETADLSKLPPAQALALTAQDVRAYLNAHCVAGADGKTKEWRVWDKDVDPAAETPLWQAAFKRAAGKTLPWIIVSAGGSKGGFEGPLPADSASLLTLLKKYGGD